MQNKGSRTPLTLTLFPRRGGGIGRSIATCSVASATDLHPTMVQFQTNVWQWFTRLVRQFLSHPVNLRRTKKEGVNDELASQARHNMDTPKFNICVAVR